MRIIENGYGINVFIYTICDPITNVVMYVGQSTDVEKRKKAHLKCNDKHNPGKNKWIMSILETGKEPIFNIIDECDLKFIDKREQYWINKYSSLNDSLLNIQYVENRIDHNRYKIIYL